jgi:RNA polymerase sigma-70 factor (ECF subfamily)
MLENYYRELVCFLNAKLSNRQVAEDVVHDAYVRVLERSSDTPSNNLARSCTAPR